MAAEADLTGPGIKPQTSHADSSNFMKLVRFVPAAAMPQAEVSEHLAGCTLHQPSPTTLQQQTPFSCGLRHFLQKLVNF